MPRASRDDMDAQKRPARKADPRKFNSEAVPDRGVSRSKSGESSSSLRRGVGRTKSGTGRDKESLRGGTRGGGDKSKSRKGGTSSGAIPSDISMAQSDLTSSYPTATGDVLESIPSAYLQNPEGAEPNLFYLPKMVASTGMVTSSGAAGATSEGVAKLAAAAAAATPSGRGTNRFPNLRVLLAAAEDDIRLHRARQQAGKYRDSKMLKSYKIETDQNWLTRQQRLNERDLLLGKLDTERSMILKELLEGNTAGLTAKEATAIQLARWQRALELYVYDPPVQSKDATGSAKESGELSAAKKATQSNVPTNLDFLELLEKLMETSAEVS